MNDTTSTIFKSARRFFSGTMLSRVAGMMRDMSMAYVFGTQAPIASFMLAFRLSNLLRRLFGEGALQSAFIPEFEALRHQDSNRAFLFFRDIGVLLTVVLTCIILTSCLGLGALLVYGNFSEDNREVIFLTLLMMPSLLFICLFGFNASLLQCEKSYFTPSVAPVAFNIIWIVVVLLLKNMQGKEAMPYLAIGVIIACFCQWLMTVPRTISILRNQLTIPLWKNIRLYTPDVLKICKPLFLGILGVAASQINNAADSVFARYADLEGPALLWYAIRLQQLPLALFGIAIAGAILPPLSRAIKALDWEKYHHFLQYALKNTAALMLPITCYLLVVGDSCINLIYGHGDFTSSSVTGTTLCLWAYGLGLFPTALVLILAPASYAQGNYRLPAYASLITMILNCVLNTWFIVGFGLGAVSIALATSISAWVNLFFLGISLSKKSGQFMTAELNKSIIKISLATVLATFGVIFVRGYLGDLTLLLLIQEQVPHFTTSIPLQLFACLWQTGLFAVLFGACAYRLNLFPRKVEIKSTI
ncbi:MAG: murein biosynthesis integral membrane protein MurJ [Parachlamydiaceae bacterium]|nr:murein biosynthesis integral membrane protein MurJ [Parachlamydiaceae bacterium]